MVTFDEIVDDLEEFRRLSPGSIAFAVLVASSLFYFVQTIL